MKRVELIGQKFGNLTVVSRAENKIEGKTTKTKRTTWLCQCSCGVKKVITTSNLRTGNSKSCGCENRKIVDNNFKTHGLSLRKDGTHTKLYNVWAAMLNRCRNKNVRNYHLYGGRGILVCESWENYEIFHSWAYENGYKDSLTLDRKNNDGNYNPNNCRWVSYETQANNKSNNRIISFENNDYTLSELSKKHNVEYHQLKYRLNQKWPIKKALNLN